VRRLAFALAVVLSAAGLAALVEAGCATTHATGERGERPADHVPDGGWASWTPGPSYEPKPMETASGLNPQMNPIVPVSPSANPTVGH
jgi:hypothetical protein